MFGDHNNKLGLSADSLKLFEYLNNIQNGTSSKSEIKCHNNTVHISKKDHADIINTKKLKIFQYYNKQCESISKQSEIKCYDNHTTQISNLYDKFNTIEDNYHSKKITKEDIEKEYGFSEITCIQGNKVCGKYFVNVAI